MQRECYRCELNVVIQYTRNHQVRYRMRNIIMCCELDAAILRDAAYAHEDEVEFSALVVSSHRKRAG